MTIRLICREENRAEILAMLDTGGIAVDDSAEFLMVQKGLETIVSADAMIVFAPSALPSLIETLKSFGTPDRPVKILLGQAGSAFHPIDIEDVAFIRAVNNSVFAYDRETREYRIRPKLYQLESAMLPTHFIRINKSEIVNIKKIARIVPMFKGRLIVYLEGFRLPLDISRSYTGAFKERLGLS